MEDTYPPASPDQDILNEQDYVHLSQASSGKRLLNYIVDYGIAYLLYRFVIMKLLVALLTTIYAYVDSKAALYTVSFLGVLSWYILFRTAFEGLTGGKSIGKYITGTRAVNEDGTKISFKTALLRSLSRSVPFEAFSALASNPPNPWHDRWTKTCVVDESESRLSVS